MRELSYKEEPSAGLRAFRGWLQQRLAICPIYHFQGNTVIGYPSAAPTHAHLPEPESLFGPGRQRWVSMAEALGWGATDRPVPTVCAGGPSTGGPEPFPSGSRKTLAQARDRGTWLPPTEQGRNPHSAPAPAGPVVLASRHQGSGSAERDGHRHNRPADAATSLFAGEAHRWSWSLRSNNQAHATVRSLDEPAGTLFFGHRANECVWVLQPARHEPKDVATAPEAIRITAVEAGLLQTFPADYPWQGTKGQKFSQIGNAVPPRLAAHLLAPHLGRDDVDLAA